MKLRLAWFAVLLTFTSLAIGQDRPTVSAQPNTVYVSADGKFEADPDTAVVQFNISAQKNKSREAYERASQAVEQVREILRSNGIDPKTAQVGPLSIQPIFEYSNSSKPKITAYRVNTDVTLKLKDFTKVAPIAQQFSDMDVTGNQSITYTLEEIDVAKTKAVEDAYRRARLSADAVAKAGGRTLGDLSYASVDTFENVQGPRPMLMNAMRKAEAVPAPTEEFTPQEITVTAHVNAVFNLK
jgi:uncharacterized protein YggE